MIQTLIFDWDGTIHDTKHIYGCAFRKVYQTLVDRSLAPDHYYSDEDMSKYLGMSGPNMWKAFMPELPEEIRTECSLAIGRELSATVAEHGRLYPGAIEVLDELCKSGYHMVILSNCRENYLQAHREHWKLDRWFTGFYCSETYAFIPKENIYPTICENHPGPFAVIGDRDTDLAISKVHGIPSIGCAYGFGTNEELSVATLIAQDIKELPELITRL